MRKAAKLPLDFTHRIRYNKSRSKAMRRCVGMADEGDSKSLVLITRVGSTPTTGIKKRTSPACLGEFSFLSAACDHDLVVCIGRDRHAGLHHFQPVHEKIVEKYRGVIKAGVNRLDGVRFQSVTVNGILKGIGQLPVPIQKLLYSHFAFSLRRSLPLLKLMCNRH